MYSIYLIKVRSYNLQNIFALSDQQMLNSLNYIIKINFIGALKVTKFSQLLITLHFL